MINPANVARKEGMNQTDREAAQSGSLSHFEQLAGNGKLDASLISGKDEDGRSLLHLAAAAGSLELVQLLADRGGSAVINDADDEGWTPLMSSVSAGHEPISNLLISLGAEVDKVNSSGRAPLHYAASKGNVGLLRLLLKAGAKPNRKDATGSTALHRAASAGKAEAVRVLVEEGRARLEEEDKQGQTPLLVSVEGGSSQVALFLASKGANLEAANKAGETPLSMADAALRSMLVSIAKSGGLMEED